MEQSNETFWELFMGNMNIMYFWVYLIWAYIGMVINLVFELNKRKPSSEKSPKKFDGKYYISDNWKRLIIAVILVPISILTFGGLFGMEITNDRAMLLGLGADALAEIYKRRKLKSPIYNDNE